VQDVDALGGVAGDRDHVGRQPGGELPGHGAEPARHRRSVRGRCDDLAGGHPGVCKHVEPVRVVLERDEADAGVRAGDQLDARLPHRPQVCDQSLALVPRAEVGVGQACGVHRGTDDDPALGDPTRDLRVEPGAVLGDPAAVLDHVDPGFHSAADALHSERVRGDRHAESVRFLDAGLQLLDGVAGVPRAAACGHEPAR
jgi:hypothetical protein